MSHSHHHSHKSELRNKISITIVLNIFITIGQIIGGLLSGSLSLLSDALHNLSDVIALVISYIANILTTKKQSVHQTFGFKRAEILASFINSLTLIVIAIFLIIEAIKRFNDPKLISSGWVIALAALSIILNGASVLILQHDSKNNMNIKSAYLHLFTDMLTSIAVLIGGVLMYYFKIYWIDGALTFIIAFYLIYMSWDLLKESLKVLMLFTPSSIIISEINSELCKLPQIDNIHHVHVWQLNDDQIHFEAHVDFNTNLSLSHINEVLSEIKTTLHDKFNIDHVTLQPEFDSCYEKELIKQGD